LSVLYREELLASARRVGGSNPCISLRTGDAAALYEYGGGEGGDAAPGRLVAYSFSWNLHPIRTKVSHVPRNHPTHIKMKLQTK
jgi:hypothetical protein